MADLKLSATMAETLAEALEHGGRLVRHAGGFWTYPGCPRRAHDGVPEWWVGASTINALERRSALRWTEWKVGLHRRFPIACEIIVPKDTP